MKLVLIPFDNWTDDMKLFAASISGYVTDEETMEIPEKLNHLLVHIHYDQEWGLEPLYFNLPVI